MHEKYFSALSSLQSGKRTLAPSSLPCCWEAPVHFGCLLASALLRLGSGSSSSHHDWILVHLALFPLTSCTFYFICLISFSQRQWSGIWTPLHPPPCWWAGRNLCPNVGAMKKVWDGGHSSALSSQSLEPRETTMSRRSRAA